jgi:hypothetical protein
VFDHGPQCPKVDPRRRDRTTYLVVARIRAILRTLSPALRRKVEVVLIEELTGGDAW